LASASELKRFVAEADDILVFVSADEDLCKAAVKEKLETINPGDGDALKLVEKLLAAKE
jgi:hypothetical protein